MNKPELKPCPFCGGKAVWEENNDLIENRLFKAYKVKCSKCRCSPYPNKYSGDKNELAETWNRRAGR